MRQNYTADWLYILTQMQNQCKLKQIYMLHTLDGVLTLFGHKKALFPFFASKVQLIIFIPLLKQATQRLKKVVKKLPRKAKIFPLHRILKKLDLVGGGSRGDIMDYPFPINFFHSHAVFLKNIGKEQTPAQIRHC